MEILKNVKLTDELIDYFSKRGIRTKTGKVRLKHVRSYNRFQKFLPFIGEEAISMPPLIMNEFFFSITATQSSLADELINQCVLDDLYEVIDGNINLDSLMNDWAEEYGLAVYQRSSVEDIKAFLIEKGIFKLKTSDTIFTDAVLKALAHFGIRTLSEGKIDEDRLETYERFERIYPLIEGIEKEIGADELVKRCAFTPKKSVASLVDVLQEMGLLDKFFLPMNTCTLAIEDVYEDWNIETGLNAYEREKRGVIISFLSDREIGNKDSFGMLNEDIGEEFPSIDSYFDNY